MPEPYQGRFDGVAERVYGLLYEDEDARVCRDISDEACRVVPGNFLRNILAHSFTKLGDALINPKTTLPWLLTALQAPSWIVSLLVPLRESGSMLPQLAVAAWIRQKSLRKWTYVAGAVAQGVAVLGLALTALGLSGESAGYAVLALMAAFSLARGLCSVASKDVLGKTVPKTRRGRVSGFASSVAGIGTLAFAAILWHAGEGPRPYVVLMGVAGVLWFLAAGTFATIREAPGATEGGRNGLKAALASLSVLRDDRAFRRFLTARALLVGSGLAAPLLVLLARERAATGLAYFLVAQGIAATLSGPVWGACADRSSRRLLSLTALGAGLLGLSVVAADLAAPALMATPWFLPGAFFVLSVLHDGVRLARKTYVVDLAGGNRRTDYVAVGNTLIGVFLLVAGAITAAIQGFSTGAAIGVLSVAALAAAALARTLPEVQP